MLRDASLRHYICPMDDPFIFGREVIGNELVDRKDEVEAVSRVLRNAQRMFLIGPRRYGKTSILSTAAAQASALGVVVVQVNAEEFVHEKALAAEIVAQAARRSGFTMSKAAKTVFKLFGRLRPQVSYDALRDTWSAELGVTDPGPAESNAHLLEALEGLERLAEQLQRPVALIVDEFQQLVREGGISAEGQLRAVIQRHRRVAYVFAGSDESMLMAMTGEHTRPFYRLGELRFLGPVPRADFQEHLTAVFARSGCQLSDTAAESIFDLASDVPHSIQRLALECWRDVQLNRRLTLSPAQIEARMEHLLNVEGPNYAKLGGQLTGVQRKTLKAISAHLGEEISMQPLALSIGLAATSMRRALEALLAKGIIRQIYDQNPKIRYAFEDPFFGIWVQRRLMM